MLESKLVLEARLFAEIQRALPQLEALLARVRRDAYQNECFYRLYRPSYKLFYGQSLTADIVDALQALAPTQPLHPSFVKIVADSAGRSYTQEANARWLEETRPVVEALFHAKMFLELVIQAGHELAPPTQELTYGWAAMLCLYQIR
jgi:hypothetical protein